MIFLSFSLLVLRLGVVQIVHGEDYKKEVEKTEDIIVQNPVPRGKIYDRNGKNIVDNSPKNAIVYTNYGAKPTEMLKVAERLAELIEVKPKKLSEREMKDYWLLKNEKRGNEKVSKEELIKLKEKYEDRKEYDKAVYQLKLDRITENELNELTEKDLEILTIYSAFNSGYALTQQIVKNEDVTDEEMAIVSENLQYLPGVDISTDWDRVYPYGKTLRSVLGKVTTSSEGLPSEKLDYFLARGYSRNDRVGKSYIEAEYEDVLHGQKERIRNVTDKAGNLIKRELISEGIMGKDLVLSIDIELQIAVEKIIEEELRNAKRFGNTALLDRAFVVLMDPFTGEVLTMAGKQITRDEKTGQQLINDFALGTITTSYNVGSSVKGATILTGLKTGVITTNTYFHDRPMKIKGTPVKGSHRAGLGTLNPVGALRVSSNVYMFETAIRIGKGVYRYNQPLSIDTEAFDIIRDSFSQFGLGTRTGIDLPNEQIGYKGIEKIPGKLLDLVIGQYDTYTPMQMAQYISTIANGGYRVQPRIVKEIREPTLENEKLGPIIQEMKPNILNKIDLKEEWLQTVREGFRQVMQAPGGTATRVFASAPYSPAGKTGTAQSFYDGPERYKYKSPPEVINQSLVAYAPHNKPEIAMAVVVPWAYQGRASHSASLNIGRKVLDTYFAMKENNKKEDHEHTE